jgi:hypothetical protein
MPSRALSFDDVCALAAALPGVTFQSGARGVSWKHKRRLLACQAIHKSAEPNSLMVCIGRNRRAELLAQSSKWCYLTPHYEPYDAILVRLSRASRKSLRELLSEALEFVEKKG